MVHWRGPFSTYWNLILPAVTKLIIRMSLLLSRCDCALPSMAHLFLQKTRAFFASKAQSKSTALPAAGLLWKCALLPILTFCFRVCSLIGKKVFNVPEESLDGVKNVIAICDAGQLDNKVSVVEFY